MNDDVPTSPAMPNAAATADEAATNERPWHLVNFEDVPGVPCPCGTARRAFADVDAFPGTLHVTEIASDAKRHYHREHTETYYVLDCGAEAAMELDDELVPLRPGTSVVIPPGVRHRAVGTMTVLIVCLPEFDPADEWFD